MSVSESIAREIMGKNILGTVEFVLCFRELNEHEKHALEVVPYSVETLHTHRYDAVLIADIGFAINQMHGMKSSLFEPRVWHPNEGYTSAFSQPTWRLVIKKPSKERYRHKPWPMLRIIPNEEEATTLRTKRMFCTPRVIIYYAMFHRAWHGEQIFTERDVIAPTGPNSPYVAVRGLEGGGITFSRYTY